MLFSTSIVLFNIIKLVIHVELIWYIERSRDPTLASELPEKPFI